VTRRGTRRGDGIVLDGVLSPWALPPGELVCRRLGCDEPAAWWLMPPYGRGTPWCDQHKGAALDAAPLGYAQGTGATAKRIEEVAKMPVNAARKGGR